MTRVSNDLNQNKEMSKQWNFCAKWSVLAFHGLVAYTTIFWKLNYLNKINFCYVYYGMECVVYNVNTNMNFIYQPLSSRGGLEVERIFGSHEVYWQRFNIQRERETEKSTNIYLKSEKTYITRQSH